MIRPLADRVLLEVLPLEAVSAGGIHLPETQRGRQHRGIVKAVGPGATTKRGTRIPVDVKIGETVHFNPYGDVTEIGSDNLALVRASDISYVEESSGGLAPSA